MGKAGVAFVQLKNTWKSNVLSLKIQMSILLLGAETWRTAVTTAKKMETFANSCLRRILGIWWPKIISDERCGNAHVRFR